MLMMTAMEILMKDFQLHVIMIQTAEQMDAIMEHITHLIVLTMELVLQTVQTQLQ